MFQLIQASTGGAGDAKPKPKLKAGSFRELGMLLVLIALFVLFALANPRFLSSENIMDMLRNTSILGILSVGMMVVILTEGIDLSVGAVVALSGMISALAIRDYPEMPVIVAVLISVAIGAMCGAANGWLVSKGGIIPIIATLGTMYIFRGITFIISNSAWVSANEMPTAFKAMATGSVGPLNNLIVVFIVVMAVFYYILNYTRTGRYFYAVGSNVEAAAITGIRKDNILVLAYTMQGALNGLAGVLWVSKFASAQPDTATGYEMNVIAACVLGGVSIAGGMGRIQGLLLGVLILGVLENALPLVDMSNFWQNCIRGLIILAGIIISVYVKRSSISQALKRREI
ncbi:MAG: ABC transporter permease [Clostridiales Family XIII bacterium]|jgi:rhamnose transport system permease protein|nr:ABC transporter permease [Clostridiales Family XIII bacterium]